MGTRFRRAVMAVLLTCGWIGIPASTVMAGIPEPGIVMYGQVLDDAGDLVTEGDLTVDYVPGGAGVTLTITTPLSLIEGPGGPYSYRLVVPLETELAGFPVSGGALALAPGPFPYTRTMTVEGTSITVSHEITLSPADRGTAQRVDVCTTCPGIVRVTHSADLDADYSFSLSEFLRVYELHSTTATHDYHIDTTTEDGYAPGPGPHDGLTHSADYLDGADWRIEMSEVLRMVDLFTSTEDHSYSPYPSGDDGFQKGHGDLVLGKASGATELVARVDSSAAAGGTVPVSVTVESPVHAAPSALGVRIALPAGWSYAGQEDSRAFIRPKVLDEGVLEFGWSGRAQLPLTFTFNIASHAGQLDASDIISAQAAYRVKSGRDERLSPVGRLRLSAPSDVYAGERIEIAAARDRVVSTTSAPPLTWKPRTPSTRERVLILGRQRPSTMPNDSTSRAIRVRPSSAVRERVVDDLPPLEAGAAAASATGAEAVPVPAQGPWLRIGLVLAILGIGAHLSRPSVRGARAYREGSHTK